MARLFLLNKPYQVMCQFTDKEGRTTLAEYINEKGIYPAGRLDYDSEGLLLLTNDGDLNHRITHPSQKLPKTYWIQVEGDITKEAIAKLREGVELKDGRTKPAKVKKIEEPQVWPRNPPVRFRANIPTSWAEIVITEGRNRQVRRMSASVGFPTLRLIRASIGHWHLNNLQPGEFIVEDIHLPKKTHPSSMKNRPTKRTGGFGNKRPRKNHK